MKRNKLITILCAAGALALIGIATVLFVKGRVKDNLIDRMEARNLALTDAGVGETDVVFTKEKLEKENGVAFYDIAFHSEEYKYEYEIDAVTGIVTGMNIEALFEGPKTAASESLYAESYAEGTESQVSSPKPSENSPQDSHIGLADAKKTALSDAGLEESEVTFIKEKLEPEDGIWVYVLEFYTSQGEYEYEINAYTGVVIDRSVEMFGGALSGQSPVSSDARYIDVEQAKSIAVSHAGFSESEVTFSKAESDYDDGKTVYEIEFYKGQTEYEYEVDAVSGTVLEYKSELMD